VDFTNVVDEGKPRTRPLHIHPGIPNRIVGAATAIDPYRVADLILPVRGNNRTHAPKRARVWKAVPKLKTTT
jgi:hypothetical protein